MSIVALNLPTLSSEPRSRIVRTHARARMTFYPHSDNPIYPKRSVNPIYLNFGDDKLFSIRSLSWQKVLGQAAGKWEAMIRTDRRISLFDPENGDIMPGDWVKIEIIRDGTIFHLCTGVIDVIVRDRRSAGGARVTHWSIAGRDHGACFEYPITYANIWALKLAELVKGFMTQRVKGKIGGSPADMFEVLIKAVFTPGSTSSTWQLPPGLERARDEGIPIINEDVADLAERARGLPGPGGLTTHILDVLDIQNKEETQGAYWNEAQLWNKMGETLAQLLNKWCFPLLHEMIYDIEEGNPLLVARIRERPYINSVDGTKSPWFQLKTWRLPTWLEKYSTLARSNLERRNVFQLLTDVSWEASAEEQTATVPPTYNKLDVEKFGLRVLQQNTHYIATADADVSQFANLRRQQQQRLTDWHCLNPYFWSGTWSTAIALPEIHIGQRVVLDSGTPNTDITAYVEGVAINYRASENPTSAPTASTSLTLTRGLKGTDKAQVDAMNRVLSGFQDLE